MKSQALLLIAASLLVGCIIEIDNPKDLWGDTGAPSDMEDGEVDGIQFTLTPDTLKLGEKAEIIVRSTPTIEFELVSAVHALNGLEVLDFKPSEDGLLVLLAAPRDIEPGPATLMLEYADGSLEVAKEAITVVDPAAEAVEEDTGLIEDEPSE
jgi:hypothetical protein